MICSVCKGPMKPLFSSFFCPRDCDRPWAESIEIRNIKEVIAVADYNEYGYLTFKQSWLWKPTGYKSARLLNCPYCLVNGTKSGLSCSYEMNGFFNGVCSKDMTHQVVIMNDEDRPSPPCP